MWLPEALTEEPAMEVLPDDEIPPELARAALAPGDAGVR
jgi:hypothetical protein